MIKDNFVSLVDAGALLSGCGGGRDVFVAIELLFVVLTIKNPKIMMDKLFKIIRTKG
ncbi:MAG: hypothetical protein HQL62_06480 [Magnetococcales bacterium]|nr:hypothetical protein [Magnetococcales bacterium]